MKKIQEKDQKNRKRIQDRMKGEDTLYMGDPALNWATGGWVRGRANLIYGVSGSGKSTLALKGAGAEQQKTNGYVIIWDSEYSHHDPNELDEITGKYSEKAKLARERYMMCGLDPDKVIVRQSSRIDELFYGLPELIEEVSSGDFELSAAIVDSWGGIQSEQARNKIAKGEFGAAGNQYGGNSKTMGPLLQELLRLSAEQGVTMFFVQHCINNMDEYGPRMLLLGGQKLKFLVHMVLFVESIQSKDASLLEGGIATTKETKASDIIYKVGKKIRFHCEKSRRVVEGRRGEFWFDFEKCEFALPENSLFTLATALGVIAHPQNTEMETKGARKGQPKLDKDGNPITKENKMYWEFPAGAPGAQKFHGQEATKAALAENRDLYNSVYQECMHAHKRNATDDQTALESKVGDK